uniref:Uncharacterized protein n=1 Tax=viral metagenome TaxID=1070528 RepID=A0A6C0E4R0_9ZZZZ
MVTKQVFSQKVFLKIKNGHFKMSVFQIPQKVLPILLCFLSMSLKNEAYNYYFCIYTIYNNK